MRERRLSAIRSSRGKQSKDLAEVEVTVETVSGGILATRESELMTPLGLL